MARDEAGGRVHRRRLFFIGGFDPRGPKSLHAIWAEQAPLQAGVSGTRIKLSRLTSIDRLRAGCCLEVTRGGATGRTEVEFLNWDDLVRRWWLRGTWRVMASVPVWSWHLWRAGVYRLARQRARPMFLSLILPPAVLGIYGLLALGLAALAALYIPYAALAVLILTGLYLPVVWKALDRKLGLSWLTQCLNYMWRGGSQNLPERDARGRAFARYLIEAVDRADSDEVVLVGFSLGANEAVRAMGMALEERPDLGQGRVRLSLVLVGQLCASYGLVGGDEAFRRGRERLAKADAIRLINVTSASDPASGCMISPLYGIEAVAEDRVVDRRPRFHKLLSPARFAAIRRDPLAFHFQYLHATEVAGDYDWYDLIGGPTPLNPREAIQ